ncbi:txe/YoeB family addiction module toxin [Lentilactobacillus fungorum]|uniref:Endoribonuclease YoeB n=1 Tax=Lentilactobacillus fungorum TaxID=2201250 RepID=A0ABQ3W0X6_9LACO|nr:Txe/YoeB family addiction module toxin [Lentilactobacillus fungorum]GHP13804.1 txe/YoeB family addiction module toxin [Lentilactobacillus fungorum]
MAVEFLDDAWDEYVEWQSEDRKTLKRIDQLIKSIKRDGLNNGLGKPERLKHQDGWSRRINDKDHLVYTMRNDILTIVACKSHYIIRLVV